MKLRIKSDGTNSGTIVEWEDGSPFPLQVFRANIVLDARDQPRATIGCYVVPGDIVVDADVIVTDPTTGKQYGLAEKSP